MADVQGTNTVARRAGFAPVESRATQIGPGLGSTIGQSLQQYGPQVQRALELRQAQDDQTAVNAAMTDFQQHVQQVQYGNPDDPNAPGFLQLQGKSAMDAWSGTTNGVNEYRQSLMRGMSPEQQRAFDQQSQQFQTHAFGAMGAHVGQQRQAYQQDVFRASVDIGANQAIANADDPLVLSQTFGNTRAKIQQFYAAQGVPADSPVIQSALQNWSDTTLHKIVTVKANGGDATGAYNFLQSNRAAFSPDVYAATQEAIRPRYEEERANNAYQAVASRPQAIPDNASQGAVWNVMLHNESGNRQADDAGKPVTSSKGAIGAAQLMPATAREVASKVGVDWDENRFRTDGAYNRALGEAYFGQMVDQFGGNLTLACAAYNAGPGQVEKWCRQFGDPRQGGITSDQWASQIPFKETRDYVTKAGASLSQPNHAPSYQAPDFAGQEAALAGNATLNEREKSMALSYVRRDQSIWNAQTATARTQLERNVNDLRAAYTNGNTQAQIPADQITQLRPPEDAKNTIDTLNILRQGAIEADNLRYASPEELNSANERDAVQMQGEDVSHYQARQQVLQQRNAVIQNMQKQMQADPASYVAQAPALEGARNALQQAETSGDPSAIQSAQSDLTRQSMALQQHIAPYQSPRMLTNAQVQQIGAGLSAVNPAKDDVLPHLQTLETQFGPNWHQAFEELVTQGKMSPDYMILANMGRESQATGRAIYARSLGQKLPDLENAVPQAVARDIRGTADSNPIDDALASFKATLDPQAGGGALYGQIRNAVHRQALNYAATGQNAEQAVTSAVSDIVGQYDTAGTIRAPKGELGAVQSATAYKLEALMQNDIAPPPSRLNIPESDRADYALARAKRLGQWVMNSNETGYNLVVPTQAPGQNYTVMTKAGTPLTVSLQDIRSGALIPTAGPDANSFTAKNMRYEQQRAAAAAPGNYDALGGQ